MDRQARIEVEQAAVVDGDGLTPGEADGADVPLQRSPVDGEVAVDVKRAESGLSNVNQTGGVDRRQEGAGTKRAAVGDVDRGRALDGVTQDKRKTAVLGKC